MAPTVRQIRQGLADRLDTIDGLRAFSTVPGQFSPPAGIVAMPERRPVETFQLGTDRWHCLIWVIVARQADAQSEKLLEGFLDPTGAKSVRAAVYADRTLDGKVNDVFEESAEPTYFVLGPPENEIRYLGLEFEYRILATGRD